MSIQGLKRDFSTTYVSPKGSGSKVSNVINRGDQERIRSKVNCEICKDDTTEPHDIFLNNHRNLYNFHFPCVLQRDLVCCITNHWTKRTSI